MGRSWESWKDRKLEKSGKFEKAGSLKAIRFEQSFPFRPKLWLLPFFLMFGSIF